tara:strand:+ start:8833 stop:9057 length:225 start_codon:yes stop_codon:yes gene_type:complete
MQIIPGTFIHNYPKVKRWQHRIFKLIGLKGKIKNAGFGKRNLVSKEIDIQPSGRVPSQFGTDDVYVEIFCFAYA